MRVPRLFAPDLPAAAGELELVPDEATHVGRVLRLQAGAAVELFDGRGGVAAATIREAGRRRVVVAAEARGSVPPALGFRLTCAVAPPKAKRAQRLIEALTELGTTAVAWLSTARSQNRTPDAAHVERWSREAVKQCRRGHVLGWVEPLDLAGLCARARAADLALLADPAAPPWRDVLPDRAPADVWVAVGPEGGFDPAEVTQLEEAGFRLGRLGGTILRIETAAVAATAALVAAWS